MLKAGVAVKDITPSRPQYMCGYVMRGEKSKGMDNDLTVTALALKADEQLMVLISAEIIMIDEEMSKAVREVLSAKYSIPERFISIGAVHTHSAPVTNTAIDSEEKLDREYRQFIISQMVNAAEESINNLQTADNTIYRCGRISGLYGNRNNRLNDGDKWVHIIDFKNDNNVIASIVNFSCHGTVLGPDNYYISADLPGEVRRRIKEKTGVPPLIMNGNSGDMGNRQYRQGNDINELKRVGTEICSQIFSFNDEVKIKTDNLSCEEVNQKIHYEIDKNMLKNLIAESELKLENEDNYDKKKLLTSGITFLKERMNRDKSDVNIDITSLIYKLGDLAIITIPGELFSKLGLKLKKDSDYKPTLIFGYANNFNGGYLVSENDYGDSYESITTEIPKGKPEELMAEILKHLKK